MGTIEQDAGLETGTIEQDAEIYPTYCQNCGKELKTGIDAYDDDYCCGKCKAEKAKPKKKVAVSGAPCRYCGNERKEGMQWFDADYCSGKCKKNDGGDVMSALGLGDDSESGLKKQEIGKLNSLVSTKQIKLDSINELIEKLRDQRGELMLAGKGEEENAEQTNAALELKKTIAADIALIKEDAIPKRYKELERIKDKENRSAKFYVVNQRPSYIERMQEAFDAMAGVCEDWEYLVSDKVSLNKGERDLCQNIIISDLTRKYITRRIAGKRVAKKANHE